MDSLPQGAAPLSVDDPHLEYPPFPAFGEIMGHEIPHLSGLKGVEIKDSVDRDFRRFLSHEIASVTGLPPQRRIRLSAILVPIPLPYPSCIMSIAIGSR